MKYVFMLISLIICSGTFAQKKKTTKTIPPPPVRKEFSPPKIQSLIKEDDEDTKCFVYIVKEEKEGRVFVTENLLEYGWNNDLARIVITTYDYDPVAVKKAEEEGYLLGQTQRLQFIEGTFNIKDHTYTFIPTKLDKFKTETFKISFEGKSKKVKHLTNNKNEVFEKGACLEPILGA